MVRQRIGEWNIHKNVKEAEMKYVWRKLREAEKRGTPRSSFKLRGRELTLPDVRSHFSKKLESGQTFDELCTPTRSEATTPTEYRKPQIFITPPANNLERAFNWPSSTSVALQNWRSRWMFSGESERDVCILHEPGVAACMHTSLRLKLREKALRLLRSLDDVTESLRHKTLDAEIHCKSSAPHLRAAVNDVNKAHQHFYREVLCYVLFDTSSPGLGFHSWLVEIWPDDECSLLDWSLLCLLLENAKNQLVNLRINLLAALNLLKMQVMLDYIACWASTMVHNFIPNPQTDDMFLRLVDPFIYSVAALERGARKSS